MVFERPGVIATIVSSRFFAKQATQIVTCTLHFVLCCHTVKVGHMVERRTGYDNSVERMMAMVYTLAIHRRQMQRNLRLEKAFAIHFAHLAKLGGVEPLVQTLKTRSNQVIPHLIKSPLPFEFAGHTSVGVDNVFRLRAFLAFFANNL